MGRACGRTWARPASRVIALGAAPWMAARIRRDDGSHAIRTPPLREPTVGGGAHRDGRGAAILARRRDPRPRRPRRPWASAEKGGKGLSECPCPRRLIMQAGPTLQRRSVGAARSTGPCRPPCMPTPKPARRGGQSAAANGGRGRGLIPPVSTPPQQRYRTPALSPPLPPPPRARAACAPPAQNR